MRERSHRIHEKYSSALRAPGLRRVHHCPPTLALRALPSGSESRAGDTRAVCIPPLLFRRHYPQEAMRSPLCLSVLSAAVQSLNADEPRTSERHRTSVLRHALNAKELGRGTPLPVATCSPTCARAVRDRHPGQRAVDVMAAASARTPPAYPPCVATRQVRLSSSPKYKHRAVRPARGSAAASASTWTSSTAG